MGVSSRTGIISAIYKKGDKTDIVNYRPTSLLNLEYKIYTTILKNCIRKTLDAIIIEDESAAIKERTILHTLSTVYDIIDMSNTLNKKLSVISLNFLKAFYRVDWDFILFVLCKFGYWNKFIHIIQDAYTSSQYNYHH